MTNDEKLAALKRLHDRCLITGGQYEQARIEIQHGDEIRKSPELSAHMEKLYEKLRDIR